MVLKKMLKRSLKIGWKMEDAVEGRSYLSSAVTLLGTVLKSPGHVIWKLLKESTDDFCLKYKNSRHNSIKFNKID